MKSLVFIFTMLLAFEVFSASHSWQEMDLEERAEVLVELEYTDDSELPPGTSVVSLVENWNFDVDSIEDDGLKTLALKVLETFEAEVSREAIEQSYYYSEGPVEVTSFYVLFDSQGEVLGGYVSVYQAGVDEDGEDSDISWSSSMRFDPRGDLFLDSNGWPVDGLYFEWSGH